MSFLVSVLKHIDEVIETATEPGKGHASLVFYLFRRLNMLFEHLNILFA